MSDPKKEVGERLRNSREKANLKQNRVAKSLGIHNSTLAKYESGEREADYDTICKLAEIYGVNVEYLITGQKNNPNKEQMINKIIQNAGEANSPQRDKFANEFLEILPSIPDDAKKIILDLMKHIKEK